MLTPATRRGRSEEERHDAYINDHLARVSHAGHRDHAARCAHYGLLVRPTPGDYCMFCSYGSVACPSQQEEHAAGESQSAGMMDTAWDELAAYTAKDAAMSQRFEDEERMWRAQFSSDVERPWRA